MFWRTGKTDMQLPREKPGEALTPAIGVHAGVGTGGHLRRLLACREFRESPGRQQWWQPGLGHRGLGKVQIGVRARQPRGGEKGGCGFQSPAGAALGGSEGFGAPLPPANSTDSGAAPSRGERARYL